MNRANRNRIFFISLAANILVILLVFGPIVNMLYGILEVGSNVKKSDAIILLGSAVYQDKIFAGDTYQRLFRAFYLYKDGYGKKIIICAGPMPGDTKPVADIMKEVLVDMGANENDIISERTSRNTYESIVNILPVLKKMEIKDALLVTSSFHMYRSLAICRKLGLNVYPAAVSCYEKDLRFFWHRASHIPLIAREYGAIIYSKLHGWI